MATTVPSLLILGTDAVLAASPSTPVQLAHACLAAGYSTVVPATWGDELIAARVVDRLRGAKTPLVQCCCPLVSQRLAANGDAIAAMLLCLVPPPVAAASYLRALYAPARPRVTFVGGCAAGSDDSIDVWMSPEELIAGFAGRGISLADQPREFDSVIPPDRRRFHSEPGGIPSQSALRRLPVAVECVELQGDDLVADIAQHLLAPQRTLIDAAAGLGCACSGAVGSIAADGARSRVREHEPPRALAPVVDHSVPIGLDAELSRTFPVTLPQPRVTAPAQRTEVRQQRQSTPQAAVVEVEPPRRRSPPGIARPVFGAMPRARTETGRQLPRAYVARRRSSPRGTKVDPRLAAESGGISARRFRLIWIGAGVLAGLALSWLVGLLR